MKKTAMVVLTTGVVGLWSGSAGADPTGDWKRPNGEIAEFYKCEEKLCCKIVEGASPGFEMCHGMTQTGPDEWQGQGMKHPEMPGFMTFNGTVKLDGPTLNIKGCAIGQAFCASEEWTKIK
jgi:uncharacterized protein (DUF2147 family)